MSEKLPKPPGVKDAQIKDNVKVLQAMGRSGGKASAESRRRKKEEKEERDRESIADATAQEREHYSISEEGDILPPSKP
jgi:hypothetical protein